MKAFESSNPALSDATVFNQSRDGMVGERSNVATLQGVVNKTALLTAATVAAGGLAYQFLPMTGTILTISCVAAMVVGMGFFFLLKGNPKLASTVGWVYAAVEGVFLGMLTKMLDGLLGSILASRGSELGVASEGVTHVSLALPAFVITISLMVGMLVLYSARIIRPTRRFKAIIGTAVAGIMFTYMISFALSFFGVSIPFLNLGSAMAGGTEGWIGLGLSVVILGVASLTLIIDFEMIENIVANGSPKYMEWYAAFALLVTLAWIYYEAVKLSFRVAILLANRD